jgi:outer membrane protein FlgP
MSRRLINLGNIVLIGSAAVIIGGCSTCCTNIPPSPLVATPKKIQANGYGSQGSFAQYTSGQQKLMAMRAAEVDAYRKLAELVHGFRVTGNTTVSAFATQSDSVRTYVDSFIRGARIVDIVAIADGNFAATVELDITPQFISCMQTQTNCSHYSNGYPGYNYSNSCHAGGCGMSSVNYVGQ